MIAKYKVNDIIYYQIRDKIHKDIIKQVLYISSFRISYTVEGKDFIQYPGTTYHVYQDEIIGTDKDLILRVLYE